jgi:hypothetical protein
MAKERDASCNVLEEKERVQEREGAEEPAYGCQLLCTWRQGVDAVLLRDGERSQCSRTAALPSAEELVGMGRKTVVRARTKRGLRKEKGGIDTGFQIERVFKWSG